MTVGLSIFDKLMARGKDWQLAIGFWQLARLRLSALVFAFGFVLTSRRDKQTGDGAADGSYHGCCLTPINSGDVHLTKLFLLLERNPIITYGVPRIRPLYRSMTIAPRPSKTLLQNITMHPHAGICNRFSLARRLCPPHNPVVRLFGVQMTWQERLAGLNIYWLLFGEYYEQV